MRNLRLFLIYSLHVVFAAPNIFTDALAAPEKPEPEDPNSFDFWWKLIISVSLMLAGGVFAGYVNN